MDDVKDAHNAVEDAMTYGKLVLMSAEKYGSATIAKMLKAAGVEMAELGE